MGQVLGPDKIRSVVKTSGTQVQMSGSASAPIVITVGGQQYSSSSSLILNTGTIGAGGLDTGSLGVAQVWYIHAVVSGGALALIASLSKTAPTGFPTFKWTGWILFTNTSSQVSLTSNSTTWEPQTDLDFNLGTGPGTPTNKVLSFTREGSFLRVKGSFTSGTLSSGQPIFVELPGSLQIAFSKLPSTPIPFVGEWSYLSAGVAALDFGTTTNRHMVADSGLSNNRVYAGFNKTGQTTVSKANYGTDLMSSGDSPFIEFRIPILGWDAEEL